MANLLDGARQRLATMAKTAWAIGVLIYLLQVLWQRLHFQKVLEKRVAQRQFKTPIAQAVFAMVANRGFKLPFRNPQSVMTSFHGIYARYTCELHIIAAQ